MAKAELNFKTKTRNVIRQVVDVQEVKKVSGVTLTLTRHEARTLRTLLRLVGGNGETSLRAPLIRVSDALDVAGVGYYVGDDCLSGSLCAHNKAVIFRDNSEKEASLVFDSLPEPAAVTEEVKAEEGLCHSGGRIKHTTGSTPEGVKGKLVRAFLRGGPGCGLDGTVREADEWAWTMLGGLGDIVEYEVVEEEPKPAPVLRVGARIRITEPDKDDQGRKVGDTGTVVSIGWSGPLTCCFDNDNGPRGVSVGLYSKFEVIG